MFYKQLKQHYSSRKYRELISLKCAERCLQPLSFREDDLSRSETNCFQNCFHKTYRYLAYSNTFYSYLVSESGAADDFVEKETSPEELFDQMSQEAEK